MCFHEFSNLLLAQLHMGIVDIYMVFLPNEFSCDSSDVLPDQLHTSIVDIDTFFPLNEFVCVFSNLLLAQLHMGIDDIYMVFLPNETISRREASLRHPVSGPKWSRDLER